MMLASKLSVPDVVPALLEMKPKLQTSAAIALLDGYLLMSESANTGIPRKADLDLSVLRKAAQHLVLCAIQINGPCTMRLFGEEPKSRFPVNLTGQNYYDYVPDERRAHARKAMEMVISIPCGFRAETVQTVSDGKRVRVEALCLPMLSDEVDVDGFIILTDQQMEGASYTTTQQKDLIGADVVSRTLIDLGHGVDTSFQDRISV